MCSIPIKSLNPPRSWPGEFFALAMACTGIRKGQNSRLKLRTRGPGREPDAFAIHGRLGAQVALLQSLILPTAMITYHKRRNFSGGPVDKPHICISWSSLCRHSAMPSGGASSPGNPPQAPCASSAILIPLPPSPPSDSYSLSPIACFKYLPVKLAAHRATTSGGPSATI